MLNRLRFGPELQKRLDELLRNAGFHLESYGEEPFEYLQYKRENPQADYPDVISFHGVEEWHGTSIVAAAWTHIGDRLPYSLKTLKELIPDYPHSVHDDRWYFENEVELDKQLNDMVELIQTRLLPWFENPVYNPAGLDMRPKQVLSDAELRDKLHEVLRYAELALERAVKAGDVDAIEREKRSVKEYKSKLRELDS